MEGRKEIERGVQTAEHSGGGKEKKGEEDERSTKAAELEWVYIYVCMYGRHSYKPEEGIENRPWQSNERGARSRVFVAADV